MLSAVIIVLSEVLEAAILIATLLVVSNTWFRSSLWLIAAVVLGVSTSVVMAKFSSDISDAFDGVGQELFNASVLIVVPLLILVHHYLVTQRRALLHGNSLNSIISTYNPVYRYIQIVISVLLVVLAVQRECTEIIIYVVGFTVDPSRTYPVLTGSIIGGAIGISCGVLLYYTLSTLADKGWSRVAEIILVLIAAGMISQAIMYLAQSGWLDDGVSLWDSSRIVPENSIFGHLLYAAFGYEATPSKTQIICYGFTLLTFSVITLSGFPSRHLSACFIYMALFTTISLILVPKSFADSYVDRVYHPYVEPLEKEIEWRVSLLDKNASKEQVSLHRLAFGQSVTEKLYLEGYLFAEQTDGGSVHFEGVELEAKYQLTEQGKYWADWGMLFEIERETTDNIWELAYGILAEKEIGLTSVAANLSVIYEFGSGINNEWETEAAVQWRLRGSPMFEPAIELYAGENSKGIGPVATGSIRFRSAQFNSKKLKYEVGAIFGVNRDTPDITYRLLLEFEF